MIYIKALVKGKFIASYPKSYDFPATENQPARHLEVYRLTIRDDDAFSEKDQFFTVSVKLEVAKALGLDKPTFEREHLGKDLTLNGVLTPNRGVLTFTLTDLQ